MLTRVGGRKWLAFLLVCAMVCWFVVGGYLTEETLIRDLLIALLAVYGAANVAQKTFAPSPKE